MIEQILLSSGSFDRVREIGGFGQPLHTLYPQIQAVLANELGADAAHLLAEPVVDRTHNRIDWYAEGDPERKPVVLSDFPEDQRQPIMAQVQAQLERGRELAERYAASGDSQRMQLGAMLKAALGTPAETDIFLVDDRPLIAHWGFTTDRPWEEGGLVRRAATPPPLPPEAPHDAAISDITREFASDTSLSTPDLESPQEAEPPMVPPELPSETPPERLEAVLVDTFTPPPSTSPFESPVSPPGLEVPAALLKSSPPPVKDRPGALLRYVVVGSGYFWSVVALAALLALGAFLWAAMRSPTPSLADESLDTALDPALTQARQTEQELQTQFEQLQAQLTEQRAQCPLPAATENAGNAQAVENGGNAGNTSTTLTTPTSANPPLAIAVAPENQAETPATIPPTTINPEVAQPSQPATAPATDPDSNGTLATGETVTRTLEEELLSSSPAVSIRTPQPAPGELPVAAAPTPALVQAEPTAEERQEFANRLTETGAATGEVTATLLWNGDADLDLVVNCPSGQMLDYQNPEECGGTLDVDANTARDSLSDRPVENVFWPADQAETGTYQILVRYAPRKDEQNPQPTPFQVRLIRNNQETAFKGTAQPRKVAPVTTFTVER